MSFIQIIFSAIRLKRLLNTTGQFLTTNADGDLMLAAMPESPNTLTIPKTGITTGQNYIEIPELVGMIVLLVFRSGGQVCTVGGAVDEAVVTFDPVTGRITFSTVFYDNEFISVLFKTA